MFTPPTPLVGAPGISMGNVISPGVSGDEREIVFSSDRVPGAVYTLYLAQRETTDQPWNEPRMLTELDEPGVEEGGWLSDGLTLYYSVTNGPDHVIRRARRPNRLLATPWGDVVTMIPDGIQPTLTPDETRMLYVGGNFVVERAGGDEVVHTSGESPSISADGLTLYYSRTLPGPVDATYVSRRATLTGVFGDGEPVFDSRINAGDPELSRDGQRLYTTIRVNTQYLLHVSTRL